MGQQMFRHGLCTEQIIVEDAISIFRKRTVQINDRDIFPSKTVCFPIGVFHHGHDQHGADIE